MNSRDPSTEAGPRIAISSIDWTPRQVVVGTSVVLAVALAFWLLVHFRLVVFSLFVGIVVSTALSPAVDWLQRRGLSRTAAVGLIYLGVAAFAAAGVLLIGPRIADQGPAAALGLDGHYQALLAWLRTSPSDLVQRLSSQLPPALSAFPAGAKIEANRPETVAQVLAYAGLIGDGLFVFAAVWLLAFYWTIERERVLRWLLLVTPPPQRAGLREMLQVAESKIGAYIRGVAVLCLIVGTMAAVVYAIIGLPSALLLGVAAGLFEAIPVVGPVLGAAPAVLIALALDPAKVVWVVVGAALIQSVENLFLVPRVMSRAVGVNPLVALLALVGFGSIFGLPSAILAIPLAAVSQLLLDRFVLGPGAQSEAPAGRDHVSLLRYELQDLVRDVRKQIREKPARVEADSDRLEDNLEAIAADLESLLARWAQETP